MRLLLKTSIIKSIIMITITWPMILNRWEFRQISQGPDASAFCHNLFQRDVPRHCQKNNQQQERSRGYKNVSENNDLQQERSRGCKNSSQNNVPVILLLTSSLKLQRIMSSYSVWLFMRTLVIKPMIMIKVM